MSDAFRDGRALAGSGDVNEEQDRGVFGDAFRRLYGKTSTQEAPASSQSSSAFIFDKLHSSLHQVGSEIKEKVSEHAHSDLHSHTSYGVACSHGPQSWVQQHRFNSFAPVTVGDDVKWHVDGCSYMWAVSRALEQARESIWILDWWLSPELYLRRPPSANEQYRLDRMLQQAANRGVKINIIVYKEVTQALTREYIKPAILQHVPSWFPKNTPSSLKTFSNWSLEAVLRSVEDIESENMLIAPPVPVSSAHTKHWLEDLHQNISVFRHPDHLPDTQVFSSSFISNVKKMKVTAANVAGLPVDALQALYGQAGETVLFWAHHEKLCLVDNRIAFMGGLDLCYGRWDTNQHSIADVHPTDINLTVFPGQDYNNARIMDFQHVGEWEKNELDITTSARMGWSDVSLSLTGPAVQSLMTHFVERWNFIFREKYYTRTDVRYASLPMPENIRPPLEGKFQGSARCQILRSCAKWSHGSTIEACHQVPILVLSTDLTALQHSIADAYIEAVRNSQHFIYIENQFFITATCDKQRPIQNKIGAAMVERILRAARAGQRYKIFITIPAVPAFAGDLREDDSLSTRAIMEFQYNSINRGGYSIMETIANEGFDPTEYIRFYNLRNYDRLNTSSTLRNAESNSGVSYGDAKRQYDEGVEAQYGRQDQAARAAFDGYQAGSAQRAGKQWDSVAECYMLGGPDIRSVPWEDGKLSEIDSFVSEELYVHSKILIADDRVVICGSANLNDRSQHGTHDSEIAIYVEDSAPINSYMNGRPWQATRFAASLRRHIFRKHLGLLKPQDYTRPDANFEPVNITGNDYDWGSAEDRAVEDPLSNQFLDLWNWRAHINTQVFDKVFHPVPCDAVRTWQDYDQHYGRFFRDENKKDDRPSRYKWGHVVAEEFAPGPEGVWQVKEELAKIRGTLVNAPLLFLDKEDIAPEGLSLNAFTEEVYT